jgi:hypothetical protein
MGRNRRGFWESSMKKVKATIDAYREMKRGKAFSDATKAGIAVLQRLDQV